MTQIPVITNAWDLLNERTKNISAIVTFCEQLDNGLGGGIRLGHVTEIAGPASIGKTQMCFQLMIDVQLPTAFGGVDGSCIYLDTECCYIPKRVEEIAKATIKHCQEIASSSPELKEAAQNFTLQSILDRIYVRRCHDLPKLFETIEGIENFVMRHPKIKLVIVDSLAFHFRDDQGPIQERRRLLLQSILTLVKVAAKYKIAVVAVNQMTTRPTADGHGFDEPALNELLTQNAGDQIIFGWRKRKDSSDEDSNGFGVERCAVLYKSSHKERLLSPFQISSLRYNCSNGLCCLAGRYSRYLTMDLLFQHALTFRNIKMKFAAKTADTGHVESFTRIVAMITRLAKQCALHISPDRISFSRPAALRSDGNKLYCEIIGTNYFDEFRMEGWSAEQNEIYLEIMPDEFHQALRSALHAASMKMKLTKKNNAPYLTFEVNLSTSRTVTHDVPINVIAPRLWSEFAEPVLSNFNVSIYLPAIKTIQKIVTSLKSMANYVTISANKQGGDMTFRVRTEAVELTTYFKDLLYAEWREEGSEGGSQRSQLSGRQVAERQSATNNEVSRDEDRMYSARVDIKTLSQFLASQQSMHYRLILSIVDRRLLHFCAVGEDIRFQYFIASVDE